MLPCLFDIVYLTLELNTLVLLQTLCAFLTMNVVFQVFYTEVRNGRPLGVASATEVPLSLDMLTTVSRGSASSVQKHFFCLFFFFF